MQTMLSGIKPTGRLTLGNYIGAIRQFVQYQDEYDMYIFIANLHAITVAQDPAELKKNTKDLIALYLACGLDPKKVTLFLQSDVRQHAELGWIMTCHTYMGELQRMTQFKELARNLAERFNNRYGDVFRVPQPLTPKVGAKIYSLQNPTKKMSKSEENPKGTIDLLDDPAAARNKIKSAVTDSLGIIRYDPENQPGISNLLMIHSSLSNEPIESIVQRFENKGYGELKKEVGDIVFDFLSDLQKRYREIIASGQVDEVLREGNEKAGRIAEKKLRKIKKKLGFQILK